MKLSILSLLLSGTAAAQLRGLQQEDCTTTECVLPAICQLVDRTPRCIPPIALVAEDPCAEMNCASTATCQMVDGDPTCIALAILAVQPTLFVADPAAEEEAVATTTTEESVPEELILDARPPSDSFVPFCPVGHVGAPCSHDIVAHIRKSRDSYTTAGILLRKAAV